MSGISQTIRKCVLVVGLCGVLVRSMEPSQARCGTGEWSCQGLLQGQKCINLNKYCDSVKHCPDGSDEPPGCTNCNQTYSGKAGIKYQLRVTGPLQRFLPFACRVSFVAMGGDFGDFVELSFLSFQVGKFELKRNVSTACRKGYMKVFEPSTVEELDNGDTLFGEFCGRLADRSATFYSKSSSVVLQIDIPAFHPSGSFGLFLTFRFLNRPPLPLGGQAPHLGSPIPGTFCDRVFLNCHQRDCRIRSPNFPGFYPRNVTCNYRLQQVAVPHASSTSIVLRQDDENRIRVPRAGDATSTSAAASASSAARLSTDCLNDFSDVVAVYDGPSTDSPLIARLCGEGPLPELVSSGPMVLVQLRSAPAQVLLNSRLEIAVSVRFDAEASSFMQRDAKRCRHLVDATRHRRSGVIHSPTHTAPANSTCEYRFVGASGHDRVWLYFVSYVSRDCESGVLEMFDSEDRWSVLEGEDFDGQPSRFCGGEAVPRLCLHAADYLPGYSPDRPCRYPQESYLSSGPTFVLRLQYRSAFDPAHAARRPAFAARYEFVDARQDGAAAAGRAPCDRRVDSRRAKGGFLGSPRNVLLYGRGGRPNVSCAFHFVGLPSERVRITVSSLRLAVAKTDARCRSRLDGVTLRHVCEASGSGKMAYLRGVEYLGPAGSASIGCLCNVSTTTTRYTFDSLSSNVRLVFSVDLMSPFEDYTHFGFEAKFEFYNETACETHAHWTRRPSQGALEFRAPLGRTNYASRGEESTAAPLRCRWEVKAQQQKSLYLRVDGSTGAACEDGVRALAFTDIRQAAPALSVCVPSGGAKDLTTFDMFSTSWRNASSVDHDARDAIYLEIVSPRSWEGVTVAFSWIEVARPFFNAKGRPLRNADCGFECPDIGACIERHLVCDGADHCPSGFDESPSTCDAFSRRLEHLSIFVVAACLFLLLGATCAAWAVVRHRQGRQEGPGELGDRTKYFSPELTPTADYAAESPLS